jgi:ATP-dependent DNA helicase RecG
LEELLVNAIFHKSYREAEPVEIRIYLDRILILNYPGPAKWIDMGKLSAGKIVARKYRNRRIGEFLKEIDLSEKQSTGITKVLRLLERNGSPPLEYETDADRNYLIATIRVREGFEEIVKQNFDSGTVNGTINGTINGTVNRETILQMLSEEPNITYDGLSERLSLPRRTIAREMKAMREQSLIKRIGSNKNGYWEIIKD